MPRDSKRKVDKNCEGCRRDRPSRFRLLANLFLCDDCNVFWHTHGKLPDPEFEDGEFEDDEDDGEAEVRW